MAIKKAMKRKRPWNTRFLSLILMAFTIAIIYVKGIAFKVLY